MTISTPIPMRDLGDYLDYSECEKILSSASSLKEKVVIGLLWRCGLRAFEIGLLKKKYLSVEDKALIVYGKGRTLLRIPVEVELFGWLVELSEGREPDDKIVPITRFQVWSLVKRLTKKSGVVVAKNNEPVHPHTFRHSLAINLVKNGVPIEKVRQILRHSSLVPTTYYLQFSKEELAKDYDEFWERMKEHG